jgi:hypothetical protein
MATSFVGAISKGCSQIPHRTYLAQNAMDGQFREADQALCGCGELCLSSSHAHHRVAINDWRSMTSNHRQKVIAACFKQQAPFPVSTSSDRTLTVPTTPGAGKRPHQRTYGACFLIHPNYFWFRVRVSY